MNFFLALIPILIILALMVWRRWGASQAGAAGYLSALILALAFFGADTQVLAFAHARAFLLSLDVLLIIWAAFLLYRVADEAGAVRAIGETLPILTADRGMQALIIGFAFASFLQGVGGFGVPVAVTAPLLIGLGFPALEAVLIPSVGHAWAVTFGSLGSSFIALMAATGLPQATLAPAASVILAIGATVSGPMVVHIAEGWQGVRRLWLPATLMGLSMGVVQIIFANSPAWNIAAFLGGIGGLLVCLPLAQRYRGQRQDGIHFDLKRLGIASSGYILMIVVTLVVAFWPDLKSALNTFTLEWQFPQITTSLGFVTEAGSGRKLNWFGHAGALLLYASIGGYLIYRAAGWYKPGSVRKILDGTVRRVLSSSASIVSMVAMATIMQHAGMTDALARGLAEGVGAAFPAVAPWIGALGAFMTGSNTNSNVLFGGLQLRTAELLALSAALILAAQTAGAAFASAAAPTKVVVGASTAGMEGREGEVMARLLLYIGLIIGLISILTVLAIGLVPASWLGGGA